MTQVAREVLARKWARNLPERIGRCASALKASGLNVSGTKFGRN